MAARDKEDLLRVAKVTDDMVGAAGYRPEAQGGIITMLIHANGGKMEEDQIILGTALLESAAKVAGITGRQPVYEFVADVLLAVGE